MQIKSTMVATVEPGVHVVDWEECRRRERERLATLVEQWADPDDTSAAAEEITEAFNEGYPHRTGTEKFRATLMAKGRLGWQQKSPPAVRPAGS